MQLDLASLGQIAGIAGIAVGCLVLVFRSIIEQGLKGVSAKDRARVITLMAGGAFVIGVLGIGAWSFSASRAGTSVVTRGDESPGVAAGGNVSIGGSGTTATDPRGAGTRGSGGAQGVQIETGGPRSPGVAAGGDVRIQGDSPATPAQPRP
ncbi:MAG: hypothetical protein V4653_06690 [Pseudomonadota bacterium]